MIKASELRIGNYLFMPFTSENVKVTGLALKEEKTQVMYIQSNFGTSQYFALPEQYSPIELTEELLLKFGFNTEYKKGYIGKDPEEACACDFVLAYPYRMGEWQTYFAWEFDNYKFQQLEYVHELQNLYFALTGSELVFSTEP